MAVVMTRPSSGPPNSLMSAPAAKMRSPPVTTTAPGRSAASASARARNVRINAPDRAFTLGLSRVRMATPSSRRSRRTSSGSSGIPRPYLSADPLQQLVGRRPGVEAASNDARLQPVVPVAPAQLAGPDVEPRDDDAAQLVAQAPLPPLLQHAGLLGEAAMVEHGLPQLGRPLAAGA